jgi:uncharacterized iron-regulated membrane protein
MTKQVALYAAVWRWHFYAGLLTLPFLMLLAVTGGVYLFKDEITDVVYRDLVQVSVPERETLAPSRVVAAATAAVEGGTALGYLPPPAAGRSARVYLATPTGHERDVFVDPYSGAVLGDLPKGDYGNLPLMGFVRSLHSLALLGAPGNRLIEIVAGWALVLVATGVYLWWPRGRKGGVLSVRLDGARFFGRESVGIPRDRRQDRFGARCVLGHAWISGIWRARVRRRERARFTRVLTFASEMSSSAAISG